MLQARAAIDLLEKSISHSQQGASHSKVTELYSGTLDLRGANHFQGAIVRKLWEPADRGPHLKMRFLATNAARITELNLILT